MRKALGMVLMVSNLQPLAAGITLAARVVFIRPNLEYFVVSHLDFQPAVLGTQYTGCFMPRVHFVLLCPNNKPVNPNFVGIRIISSLPSAS
jgi:hypothetical protein